MSNKRKGQGLVEFALVLPVILFAFCVIIESGRLFHAYTTVQHAAREGARYAVTGQEMLDAGMDRVESIKWVTKKASGSLMVDPDKYWDIDDSSPYYGDSGALIIRVWGPDGINDAGGPGERVKVSVAHNMPIITPLLLPITSYVRVTGEVEMINEGFGSGTAGGGHQGVMPPTLMPLATIGASPIPPTAFILNVEADHTTIHKGDTVEFTYSVTNNADMDLAGVQISDYWDDPVCTIDIADGATGVCTTEQAIDETMTNDVSASRTPFSDADSITIKVIEPELTLTARSWETTVFRDTVLTFTYSVENTGNAPVAGVHVVDSLGTDTSPTAQDTVNGDTVTWEVSHVMDTPGTIVVNVTAIGTDELAAPVTDDQAVVVEVLDLDPIDISEPLMAGQTVVTGTAHAGRTVFIYDPQDSRVSGAATVNGAGQFSFVGLPPLIAGHTIVVNGYGAYDSARVQGELDPIIITTDPLCHGATNIAGTAQPGELVRLSMPGYSDSIRANVDTGQFQFVLYGGATFQYGQTVEISGYGATPATKVVTWCGAGGDAFIVISPQCAPAGSTTTVRVEGYNWAYQNKNDDVNITWDSGSAVYDVPDTPPEPWVQEIAVSTSPAGGTYTIQASNSQDSASAEFVFPCPAPNLVVTDVQLETTGVISTYQPVQFSVTVVNTGTMPVNSLFWVDLYEPTLPAVGIPQPGFAWGAVSNLAPGDSVDVTVTYINGFATTGDHYIHARADSMTDIDETDEDDNDFTDVLVPVTLTGTPPGPPPGTGAIGGYVLNAASGAGADRARVWCTDPDTGAFIAETYADPEGAFVLTGLPPGTYLLQAELWIGGDWYYGAMPTQVTIVGDDVVGPVIFFIRRQ
ncbi:MAG: TadE/TadG family type IV pilus assembly protein [Anaerolineae bacterium]|jgi:uncharacterized repeat protein (TIGR01451 family)